MSPNYVTNEPEGEVEWIVTAEGVKKAMEYIENDPEFKKELASFKVLEHITQKDLDFRVR